MKNNYLVINRKVPVLAYHEVNPYSEREKQTRIMGPSCSIHRDLFEQQMSFLKDNNFESINSFDVAVPTDETPDNINNKIIITFDDGHIGNYLFAYPILREFNLSAIFFVTIDFIGKKDMMTWEQLKEMSDNCMSIQSHCVSHSPLETLTMDMLRLEIRSSKEIIEDKVGKKVTSLSLPHGSQHPGLLQEASDCGYKFVCTSEINYYNPSSAQDVKLIPRIPVPDTSSIELFSEIVLGNGNTVESWRRAQNLKSMLKKIIGINNYRKIYRFIYNVKIGA